MTRGRLAGLRRVCALRAVRMHHDRHAGEKNSGPVDHAAQSAGSCARSGGHHPQALPGAARRAHQGRRLAGHARGRAGREEAIKAVAHHAALAHDTSSARRPDAAAPAARSISGSSIPSTAPRASFRKYPFFLNADRAHACNLQVVLGVSRARRVRRRGEAGVGGDVGGRAWLDDVRLQVATCANVSECCISLGNQRTLARGPRWAKLAALIAEANRVRGYGGFLSLPPARRQARWTR